jgi:predicted metal-dependent phosphoesterase TrpH
MELDLHVHTRFSRDSRNDPARVIETARRRGRGGIAVCDHDAFGGVKAVRALAPPGFLVIPGMEISTRFGHLLGLFLREPVRTKDPFEAVEAIHAQGGLAVLAHPFARHRSIDPAFASVLDGCEGYNARYSRASRRRGPGGEPKVLAFARERGLAVTGGSDAHFLWEIGRGRTVVEGARTLEDIKRAIREQRTTFRAVKASSILNRAYSGVVHLARPRRRQLAD